MNDYQEYRSYGSYLSRVFAIIIAFALLVFAVWGIVRLANDNDDGTLGDTSAPSMSEEADENGESDDLFVSDANDAPDVNGENDDPVVAGSVDGEEEEEGQTLSTNTDIAQAEAAQDGNAVAGATTDGLPETGANPAFVLALGAVAFVGSRMVFARNS